jgi:hypothetical protein
MTLGHGILYAALAGLIHGGLTRNPARWAGLRHAAPLALWDRLKAEAYHTAGALIQAQRAVIPQPKASPWVCVYP